MSSESESLRSRSPTATSPDTICTDPVNCQWGTCTQQFSRITDLVRHIEMTHMPKGIMKDYVCLWRDCLWKRKPFKDKCRLVNHLRIITGEKPNECTYQGCNKTFSKLDYLRVHLQRHTRENHYKCQIKGCNKSFYSAADFRQHQRRHSKQKPFACTLPECDKRFADHIALSKHIRNHNRKRKKPSIETSDKLDSCLPVQGLQNNKKTLNKKHYTHDNKWHHQHSEVEAQATSLIAVSPEQHLSHVHTENGYLQLPFPSSTETSEEPLNNEHIKHQYKGRYQPSKVEKEAPLLIAAPPEQHPYHAHTDTIYLQLSFPSSTETSEKPLNNKHIEHHDNEHYQLSKVEEKSPPLIAAPPEQHQYHAHADTVYLQLSSQVFLTGLPDVNTIFDAQGLSNYLPANSHLQSQSKPPLQSPQLSSLSSNHKSLVMPLLSLTSSTNIHSHPQSDYKHLDPKSAHLPTAQCIASHLPPSYEDTQYMHYKSPLTTTQQSVMSHQ